MSYIRSFHDVMDIEALLIAKVLEDLSANYGQRSKRCWA